MNNAVVSIITPSFNRADIIHETAQSIFNQTYIHWEWIIVDDGSTDNSWDVIQGFVKSDNRVKGFKRQREPKGACTCRNIAVENAVGEYLIFLDTDDLIESFCLQNRVEAMLQHPQLDFSIFPSLMFREQPYDLNLWWNIDKSETELKRQFYLDAIAQGTGIMIRKESFIKVGKWREDLYLWQDIDLFLRLYIQGYQYMKFFELPPDLHNRMNVKSLSRFNFFTEEKTNSRVLVVKNAVDLLKRHQMTDYLKEVKYMIADIVSAMARTKKYKSAVMLVHWSYEQGVLEKTEKRLMNQFITYYKFKLYKIHFFRYIEDSVKEKLWVENTIGKLKYQ